MRVLPLLLLLMLIPIAYAEPGSTVIAIYANVPVSTLEGVLNSTYVVMPVDNLTQARGADILLIMAPTNVSDIEKAVIRRALEAGCLVIITAEPRNDSVIDTVNSIVQTLGLPTLVYKDVIYDFIHNDGNPEHPVINGTPIYSSSLVDRSDAKWKNYTEPSAVALTNSSVRDAGRLVRGEALKVKNGELVVFGGSTMFSDERYNETVTRGELNGRIIKHVIDEYITTEEVQQPSMPLIDKYLLYIAVALIVIAILKTIKAGRP